MTDRERVMEEAGSIRENCISSGGGGRALRIIADALLEAEARGVGWAGEHIANEPFLIERCRDRAAQLRAQKGAA